MTKRKAITLVMTTERWLSKTYSTAADYFRVRFPDYGAQSNHLNGREPHTLEGAALAMA